MTKNKQQHKNDPEEIEDVNVKAEEETAGKSTEEKEIEDAPAEETELDRLKMELSEAKDKYLRLFAEFENFRRRTAKERLDLVQSASQDLIVDLLPVLDDFERASKNYSEEADPASMKEGMDLIANKLKKVLEQKGVKSMSELEGAEFDSELHEAITQIPAPKEELKGKVVDVIEKGYYLNEKVIRFAKVVIGS